MRYFKTRLLKNIELLFWMIALVLLFFMNTESNYSFCFFRWIGFSWCPGCGIGHSIHSALHFQLATSLQQHPLGIVAVFVIFNRIKQLSFPLKQLYHEPKLNCTHSKS